MVLDLLFLSLPLAKEFNQLLQEQLVRLTDLHKESSGIEEALINLAMLFVRAIQRVMVTVEFVAQTMVDGYYIRVRPPAVWIATFPYETTPNTLHCFTKIGLLLYFIDFYVLSYVLWWVIQSPAMLAFYTMLKISTLVGPLLDITTDDRLKLWYLAAFLLLIEIPLAQVSMYFAAFGVDWENAKDTIYKNWSKHYKYRAATTNRKLFVDAFIHLYPLTKLFILFGYFCYLLEKWAKQAEEALKTNQPTYLTQLKRLWNYLRGVPQTPPKSSKGLLFPDFDHLSAMIEQDSVSNMRYGVLFLLALSSLSAYSIILAGWSSNSKYAFIGALRSAAQMISYEVAISLIILPIVIFSGSLNLTMIAHMQWVTTWFVLPLLPVSVLFLIAMLAETNRTPFDLPEAEAELVAGYNVDYSSLPFAMFFLGEYCNMILIATFYCILFLGGGLNSFNLHSSAVLALKAAIVWVFFVIVRATLPRYRYDQLMDIGWKVFLPVAGGFLMFDFGVLVLFNGLPVTGELPALPARR